MLSVQSKVFSFIRAFPFFYRALISTRNLVGVTAVRFATLIPNITELHLAHNELVSLQGLERLKMLQYLDVRHNLLEKISDLSVLVGMSAVNQLLLAGNPLAKGDYRAKILARFVSDPAAVAIDGVMADEKLLNRTAALQRDILQRNRTASDAAQAAQQVKRL